MFVHNIANNNMKNKQKNTKNPPNLHWRAKLVRTSHDGVPEKPGWYAIVYENRFLGLEISRAYAYFGQTRNLQRRLKQHTPQTEQKPRLKKYLADNIDHVRFCYSVAEQPVTTKYLTEIETKLIAQFKPKYNE